MRSRINVKAPAKIISCGVSGTSAEGLKKTAEETGAELVSLGKNCAELTVGHAAGFAGFEKYQPGEKPEKKTEREPEKEPEEEINTPCLIFSGFDSKGLDRVLEALHRNKTEIALKCVVTQHNAKLKIKELVRELEREHEQMNKN